MAFNFSKFKDLDYKYIIAFNDVLDHIQKEEETSALQVVISKVFFDHKGVHHKLFRRKVQNISLANLIISDYL